MAADTVGCRSRDVRSGARQLLHIRIGSAGVTGLAGRGRNHGVIHDVTRPDSGALVARDAVCRCPRRDVAGGRLALDAGATYGVGAAMAAGAGRDCNGGMTLHPLTEVTGVMTVITASCAGQRHVPWCGRIGRAAHNLAVRSVSAVMTAHTA